MIARLGPSLRIAVCVATTVTIGVAAQQPPAQQTPTRDVAPAPVRLGSAVIAGVVMDDASPAQPVRRAIVTITEQVGGVGARMAVTDDAGRFVFRQLPAGRYLVQASKAAYLPTAYGVQKPMRPGSTPTGTAIAIAEGQRFEDATLRLTRGAVVTGTVRDSDGRPVRGAFVSLAYSFRAPLTGERTLARLSVGGAGAGTTDARGVYRIFGIPPGEYIASVTPQNTASFLISNAELEATSDAEVQRLLQSRQGAQPNATPTPTPTATPDRTIRRPTFGYATVFYPGTVTLAEAQTLNVRAGEERGGVDFQIQLVPNARITGTVTGSDGRPAAGVPVRLSDTAAYAAGPFLNWITATTASDGSYVLRGARPGDYQLQVRPDVRAATAGWALVGVTVSSGVDLVQNLTLQPTRTVSGRIVLDAPAGTAPPDFARMRVTLMNNDGLPSNAVITLDGRFTITGLMPEQLRFSVSIPAAKGSPAWFLKSATLGGRDAIDATVEIPGDVNDAVVTLATNVSEISGTIQDAAGRPTPEFFIIVFPADRALWTWASRRIQQARPASDGRFVFNNLPAGEYLLAAVTDVEQNQWFETAFLEALLPASIKISLADGEKKVQNIRLR